MKILVMALFALTLGSVTALEAQIARNCADREQVLDRLLSEYGETRQFIAIGANNSIVETFASKETGTWTITVTNHNGVTCLVATGQAFEETNEEVVDDIEG